MKKFLTILLIGLCYFACQYHHGILNIGGQGIAYADDDALYIPEACDTFAQEFENTCYGTNGEPLPYTQQVTALHKIKSCLKHEGFSDKKIKKTLIMIKKKANGELGKKLSKK